MEEFVGKLWHRLVTRGTEPRYPAAAVELGSIKKTIGILFRASGGAPGLSIDAGSAVEHGARRSWRQRLAGTNQRHEFTWSDEQALRLPAQIDLFADASLNRDLYLWLACLAATKAPPGGDWVGQQQQRCAKVTQTYPGMRSRYQRLVKATLQARPDPATLSAEEAQTEQAIRQALKAPGTSVQCLIDQAHPGQARPFPVWLWLHPTPPEQERGQKRAPEDDDQGAEKTGQSQTAKNPRRHQARRVEMPQNKGALILNRFESILSWAEYVKVDRATEEEEDLDAAEETAEDMQELALAKDQKTSAKSIRFDLDLPPEEQDDTPLGEGIRLPEWDFHKSTLVPDQCCLQPLIANRAEPQPLPVRLRPISRRLRAQFEALRPDKTWLRAQPDGSELDLDAYLHYRSDRISGSASSESNLYRQRRNQIRDLSCLLLADLSLSTDAWVGDNDRVIDVIRDSLFLFAEALSGTRDRFAMYGFSSRRRDYIRWHQLKTFDEAYNDEIRGRLQGIRPGFFTRMGAAIRYASQQLEKERSNQRILLILTDGKPNDLDHYEGRYGIEDTREAILEARRLGLQPFCVTIDREGNDYLPHLFGSSGYAVIHRPQDLPKELPLLYARLTG